ncbi:MAG TPA: methionyl-tRNA formyltransferase [Acidimicrobiales bacterium]|nr:methionyl-tRNA formyltransferase [Acidimicrobiales bacterium]
MRLAFLGTPEAAVPSLRALVDAGHHVELVITRPDRKRARGGQLSPSPVKACALELGLTVRHRLRDLEDLDVERGVVVAYGRLIPADLLARTPMLNVHFSLLPRWRGAAPVERAILAGDEETGVSIMTLDVDLDTGPVHLEKRVAIDEKSLSGLLDELAVVGAAALTEVLASPELLANPVAQVGEATFAAKLSKEDFHLVPSLPAEQLLRIVRLGRAFTVVSGRRVLVESATRVDVDDVPSGSIAVRSAQVVLAATDGAIILDRVRPESAKSMSAMAWWVGSRLQDDTARWT